MARTLFIERGDRGSDEGVDAIDELFAKQNQVERRFDGLGFRASAKRHTSSLQAGLIEPEVLPH
jgi:hypothetical protein